MIYRVTGADIETTGLHQEKGDRIIEIALLVYSYNTKTGESKPLGKYVQRVYPDKAVSAKAQAIHHISIDDLIGQPLWEDVAGKVNKILRVSDVLVVHNTDFDCPFIAGELVRVGELVPEVETFCTMREGRFATYDGSVPSLRSLCSCFGFNYDVKMAHAAEYDVAIMMRCFFEGLKQGFYKFPEITIEEG